MGLFFTMKGDGMTTTEIETGVVRFGIADTKIAELREAFAGLRADTSEGYSEVTKAIATTRALRVNVEKTRKELKASALDYGRRVDGEAKRLTVMLEDIEEPLKLEKQSIDDEKLRIKREKEEAERAAIEAELKARREAEEARLRAEREAEEAKLAEERKAIEAERAKLEAERDAERQRVEAEQKKVAEQQAAERAKLDADRREYEAKQAAERAALEAKQAEIDAQREEANRVERERLAAIKAEQDRKEAEINARLEAERIAKEKAEQDRLDKIEAEKMAEAVRLSELAEAERLEAMKPDVEKIRAFANTLRAIVIPEVTSDTAQSFMAGVEDQLAKLSNRCERFKGSN